MPKIFIGNLFVESCPSYETELRELFEQFGEVTECSILTGKNYGFVVSITSDVLNAMIFFILNSFVLYLAYVK